MLIKERRWVHSEGTVAERKLWKPEIKTLGNVDNELISYTTGCQGVSQSKGQLNS